MPQWLDKARSEMNPAAVELSALPGPPDRDVALAKLLCGVLDDILNPDLLFALVGPLPPPPHPLTIGGATPPWGKLPRDGWATSDIINQAVFCYFSFYFFAIFLDLHANVLRDSARSYIASLLLKFGGVALRVTGTVPLPLGDPSTQRSMNRVVAQQELERQNFRVRGSGGDAVFRRNAAPSGSSGTRMTQIAKIAKPTGSKL